MKKGSLLSDVNCTSPPNGKASASDGRASSSKYSEDSFVFRPTIWANAPFFLTLLLAFGSEHVGKIGLARLA